MMRRWWALALVAACACSGPRSRLEDGKVRQTLDQRMERRAFIETIGIGAADPALPTETQRKALSRDAAIVKAQYELLTLVRGVTLEGGVTVEAAMAADSRLEARVHDTLRGAQVVKSEFTDDGGCVVTLRLPRRRLEWLAADFR